MEKFKKLKIVKIICFFISIDKRYEITTLSSSISFYMLISLVTLLVITFQLATKYSSNLQNFLIVKIIEIFNENLSGEIVNLVPKFTFTKASIIIIINFMWSSSKVVNGLNKASYKIYEGYKKDFFLINRLKSVLVFSLLMILIFFEVFVASIGNILIARYLGDFYIIAKVSQLTLELLVIFGIILFLYMYIPPLKLRAKAAYKGALFATVLFYIAMSLFVIFIYFYHKINKANTVIFLITLGFIMLFVLNYIILLGMVLNQRLNIPSIKITAEDIIANVNNT